MPRSSDDRDETNENAIEYYLIRVPKSIDVKELNGVQIDLEALGPSENVIISKRDPDQSYGYDLISHKNTAFSNLTRLKTTTDDNIEIDPNYTLQGCINFYIHKPQPNHELVPLMPTCPNDSIEDIVNRARGHSAKRKSPVKVKSEHKSTHKKKHKAH